MAPVSFSFSEMRLRAPRQHGLLRDAARVRETHSPVVVRQSPCRPRALPLPRVRWPGGSAGQSFFLAPQSVQIHQAIERGETEEHADDGLVEVPVKASSLRLNPFQSLLRERFPKLF